jgi:hypothetical protein
MDPPEDSDLPDDVTPDDFEAVEEGDSPDKTGESDPQTAEPDPEDDGESEESSGVLDKLRNGDSDDEDDNQKTKAGGNPEESPQEIVEEADDPEEQERRQRVLDSLNGATEDEEQNRDETPKSKPNQGDADPSVQSQCDPSPKPAQMQNGMVVDEKLLETLFGLPFDQAANVTGWDGWRLSAEEKEANARLLRAYADEQNIDLGPGVMLAMSLGSTVGGRAVGYTRYRKQQSSDEEDTGRSGAGRPADRDRQPSETRETTNSTPAEEASSETEAQPEKQEFDIDQPIGQRTPGEA